MFDELFRFLRAAPWDTPIEANADASLLAEVLRQITLRQQSILQNRKINLKVGALAELMQQSTTDYVVVKGQVVATC